MQYKLLLLFSISVFSLASCQEEDSGTVTFTVPKGFLGKFVLVPVEKSGANPIPTKGANGMEYVLKIPFGGSLNVDSTFMNNVLNKWHKETAVYANGTPIALGDKTHPNGVAFYALYTSGNGRTWYLIGSQNDFIKAWTVHDNPDSPSR